MNRTSLTMKMFCRSALITLVVFALNGCAVRVGYDYHFRFDGPDEDYAQAVIAAGEWNSCGVIAVAVSKADGSIPITYVETVPGDHAGLYYPDPAHIVYKHVGNDTRAIIAHEMGHAFGLDHSDSTSVIMSPVVGPDSHVTEADCDALRNR